MALGRPGRQQGAFTAGELDKSLGGRIDLKYYHRGVRLARNIEIVAQGGFRQRPGTWHEAPARLGLTIQSLAGASATAVSGGTAANAIDGNPANKLVTGAIVATAEVLEITLAAPVNLGAIDMLDYSSAGGSAVLKVETKIAGVYVFQGQYNISSIVRSRRCAMVPGLPPLISHIKLTVVGPTGGFGAFTLTDVKLYAEGSNAVMPLSMTDKSGNAYRILITPEGADVYDDAGHAGGFHVPTDAAKIATMTETQAQDTLLLFHELMHPWRAQVQGARQEWDFRFVPFENIPTHDYGEAYTNGVAAKWEHEFFGWEDLTQDQIDAGTFPSPINMFFVFTVSGQETNPMRVSFTPTGVSPFYTIDWGPTATTIKNEIEALPNVEPGITVTSPAAKKIVIEFTGAKNVGAWPVVSARVLNRGDAAIVSYRTVKGVEPGEIIFSDTRGYPRCGVFYQQSLLLGGIGQLGHVWMRSVVGDFYNLDTTIEKTGAMIIPADLNSGDTIRRMIVTKFIQIFTAQAEWWIADRALTKDQAPVHVLGSQNGASPGLPIIENEGASLFIGQENANIMEFRYEDTQQAFVSQSISLLAAHLSQDIIDAAIQRATRISDANRLYLTTSGGVGRIVTLLRGQDVTAFARLETPGSLRGVTVDSRQRAYAVVDRPYNGTSRRALERFDPLQLLDAAVSKTIAAEATVVTGLDIHEDEIVWAIVDGDVQGPFTVNAGQITLSAPAPVGNVIVGRWLAPLVEGMPPPREVGPAIVVRRPARIHTLRVYVIDTTSIALGANGHAPIDVDLTRWGAPFDVPQLEAGYTGEIVVEGFDYGDSEEQQNDPTWTITQVRPGRLQVGYVIAEADV